jgi:TPR repeat protein
MAQMHQRGDGVKQSWPNALEFYNFAVKQKYPPAMFVLGMLFLKGEVVKQNVETTKQLWTTAAKMGHKDAAQNLARLDQAIKDQSKPPSTLTSIDKIADVQAEDLVQKETCSSCSKQLAVDSAQWRPNACCDPTTFLCFSCAAKEQQEKKTACGSCGTKRMDKTSAEYLQLVQQRAQQGNAWAIAAIAEVCMFGHPSNTAFRPNMDKARELLTRAAEMGHTVSMTNLAAFYMDGTKGVDIDHVKAHGLFIEAAKKGSFAAVYNLGQMHERGDGVKHDVKEAVNLFNMAASKGYAPAQFALGLLFVKGEAIQQNYKAARQLWTIAAGQGFQPAIQNLKKLDQVEAQAKSTSNSEVVAKPAAEDNSMSSLMAGMEELETVE